MSGFQKKVCDVDDQIRRMRGLIRSLSATQSRAYRDFFKCTRRHLRVPFVMTLRLKQIDQAKELKELAIAAQYELMRQKAIAAATFKPGDQLFLMNLLPMYKGSAKRFIVVDVEPRRRSKYCYLTYAITKDGHIFRNWRIETISPISNIQLEPCLLPLSADAMRWCNQVREEGKTRKERALNSGEVEHLKKKQAHFFR